MREACMSGADSGFCLQDNEVSPKDFPRGNPTDRSHVLLSLGCEGGGAAGVLPAFLTDGNDLNRRRVSPLGIFYVPRFSLLIL